MVTLREIVTPTNLEWQQMQEKLHHNHTLAGLVLAAWQIGLWLANALVEAELNQRAQQAIDWERCPKCGATLHSKGYVSRRILTLVGQVEWRRRVGRCPNRCSGSQAVPFDKILGITPYQQTSVELMRLGCLLAVFVPFEIAVSLLKQLSGVSVSDATLWQWVQHYGQAGMSQEQAQLSAWEAGEHPPVEAIAAQTAALPLLIGADGVTVPFRPHPRSNKGKIVFQEIKVALLSRLGHRFNRSGEPVTQLMQRRLVAVRGSIYDLQVRLQIEAHRQGMATAPQVVWISDGARGFWCLFERCFASVAVGILDFYHACEHLNAAAQAYGKTLPNRTATEWFERLRHQLRHGYVHHILKEFETLLRYPSTPASAKTTLQQVRSYLTTHLQHLQYRQFKKLGLPIGSGMVESACKWLISQRFKGTGMRWSEAGFDHLLYLRLAWVNHRFDPLFAKHSLSPTLYSPNQ
ncbi:MAG TPA: ISKra4 family transposase [Coleofasciculaceae cyanobacterium]